MRRFTTSASNVCLEEMDDIKLYDKFGVERISFSPEQSGKWEEKDEAIFLQDYDHPLYIFVVTKRPKTGEIVEIYFKDSLENKIFFNFTNYPCSDNEVVDMLNREASKKYLLKMVL
jgi:hypothetical protein